MDEIDQKQAEQIALLQEHHLSNKRTDLAQWLTLAVVSAGLLLYINFGLFAALQSQSQSIHRLVEKCGK